MAEKKLSSLVDFAEQDPTAMIRSPRSISACKQEGVLPEDLIYKPIESFAEKDLSPRLVKLRYDFFEAKRKDLLNAARRARDTIVEKEEDEASRNQGLIALSKQTGVSMNQIMALQCDGLEMEKRKLRRAQEREQAWLRHALNHELKQLQILESNDKNMTAAENDDAEKQRENAQRLKELNDRRQKEEEQRQRERDAQAKLEKAIAKQEFHKQQEEIARQQEKERQKKMEIYQRQMAEMERKREAEREKERKKQEQYERQQQRIEEMRAEDLRRSEILDHQKQDQRQLMLENKERKEFRIYTSIQNNMENEAKRRDMLEDRMANEQAREERLALQKAIQQEEGAKHSFQLMMRRKNIQDEANRKLEERRMDIFRQQEETDQRLFEHDQKKERYLDFKRELDALKNKNKDINVERERRKQEHHRNMTAEAVRKKDEKIDILNRERERFYEIRRGAQAGAARAREDVKTSILRQRIKSKFNVKDIESQMNMALDSDLLSPKILAKSSSMPSISRAAAR